MRIQQESSPELKYMTYEEIIVGIIPAEADSDSKKLLNAFDEYIDEFLLKVAEYIQKEPNIEYDSDEKKLEEISKKIEIKGLNEDDITEIINNISPFFIYNIDSEFSFFL